MAYVTTNIRFPEEDWKYFKLKALEEKKSLSAWVRDTLKEKKEGIKKKPKSYDNDPFWQTPSLLKKLKIKDKAPKDLSLNLDKYLYG